MKLENIKTTLRSSQAQIILLILAGALTWSSSLSSEFTGYDDIKLIVDNEFIHGSLWRSLQFFWHTFSSSFNTAWTNEQTLIHRPLEQYGSALGYKLWGASAWHFHFFFNYLLHIINSVLVFLIIRRVSKNQSLSFASTLIWLVHPLHHEAINMLTSGVGFLFAHFFCFLAIYLYLGHKEAWSWQSILATFCLFTSYLGSEMLVTTPFIITALALQQKTKGRLVKSMLSFATLVFYFWHRYDIGCSGQTIIDKDFWERTTVLAPEILLHHLKLFFFPAHLSLDEQHRINLENAGSAYHLLAFTIAISLIVTAIYFYKRNKAVSAGISLALISISLALNIVPVYCLARDRYTYLFSLGLTIALVFYIGPKLTKHRILILSLIVVALGTRSWVKSLDWRNGETLWTHTINSIDDPGAKQVWRYQLLQYYHHHASKTFKANKQIQEQVLNDFSNFVVGLEQKETIKSYSRTNPETYLLDKYSYNRNKSIASGILSKAMYHKQYGSIKVVLDHLNLAFLYDPENLQTNLQLYIHVDKPEFTQAFFEKITHDGARNPYSAKLILSLLHAQKHKDFYSLAKQYAKLYPNAQIIQAYYFEAALEHKLYDEAYQVAKRLSKKYHEDKRYDELVELYEKKIN